MAIWIGFKIGLFDTLCDSTDLIWTKQSFTIYIWCCLYTPNLKDKEQLNFDSKLEGIQKYVLQWSKRQISAFGKITAVKRILQSE